MKDYTVEKNEQGRPTRITVEDANMEIVFDYDMMVAVWTVGELVTGLVKLNKTVPFMFEISEAVCDDLCGQIVRLAQYKYIDKLRAKID